MNDVADRCIFCIKTSRYSLGSRRACMNPARTPLLLSRPTVSRWIRSWASWRCSGVSHRVVNGSSGRRKMQMTAMPTVTTPGKVVLVCSCKLRALNG